LTKYKTTPKAKKPVKMQKASNTATARIAMKIILIATAVREVMARAELKHRI